MMGGHNPVLDDLARIRHELAALSKLSVHVGVLGDAGGDLLTIAAVHEYGCTINVTPKMRAFLHHIGLHLRKETGAINIPERSFIRASYDAGQQEIERMVENAIGKVMRGQKTAAQAMEEVGMLAAQMTQQFINDGLVTPPKGSFTQERSSQFTPLVESGRLVGSITFEVRSG